MSSGASLTDLTLTAVSTLLTTIHRYPSSHDKGDGTYASFAAQALRDLMSVPAFAQVVSERLVEEARARQ